MTSISSPNPSTYPGASTTQRLGHLFWIGLYWVLDAGWIWHDQIAYRDSVFDYRGVLGLHGCAPEQYRMAAILAAQWLSNHLGFHSLIAGCIAIDLVCSLLLSVLLYRLLQRESAEAPPAVTLCAKALLGLLMLAYLHAGFYAPRVETLPNSVYLLLGLLLIGNMQTLSRSTVLWGSGVVFVLLSWLQGWVRADVSVVLGAALCLAVLFPTVQLAAGRRLVLFLTGAVAALLSGLSLLWLMKVIFPDAHYCCVIVALGYNLRDSYKYLPFLVFMAPMAWGIAALARRFATLTVVERTALIAACLYFAMWSVVGSWSEMRIGVPFAMALLPFTCLSMARYLARPETPALTPPLQ